MDVHETLQIWHNYLQRGDRELYPFLKCIQAKKKPLKFAVLDLFGDISAEIWKTEVAKFLRPCYETKSLTKNFTKFR